MTGDKETQRLIDALVSRLKPPADLTGGIEIRKQPIERSLSHTSGPWRMADDGVVMHAPTSRGWADPWPVRVASAFREEAFCGGDGDAETRANGLLFAAAPELLGALSWFINDIDSTHTAMVDFDTNVERARAAIAAAWGDLS